jgi:hypothetical protein
VLTYPLLLLKEVEGPIQPLSLLHRSKVGLQSGWNLLWRINFASKFRVLHIGALTRDDLSRLNVIYAAPRIIYRRRRQSNAYNLFANF